MDTDLLVTWKPRYTPQNFPTVAPRDLYEVYPGMNKHSTPPTIPPEEMNVDYYTDNQEILTTSEENFRGEINAEETGLNTVRDSSFPNTTSKTSDQVNTNKLQPNRNETSQLLGKGSERPLVQPRPTDNQSSTSRTDNFVFPDDVEVERSYNSAGDRPKVGASVLVGGNRNIFNGPTKKCNEGSQLGNGGICIKIARFVSVYN